MAQNIQFALVALVLLVSSAQSDILFKKKSITLPTLPSFQDFTLPTLPAFSLPTLPTSFYPTSTPEVSETTDNPPPTLPASATIVPIITGLPSLDNDTVTTPAPLNLTEEEENEMLAQTILKRLTSIENKLDQIQKQLDKSPKSMEKSGEKKRHMTILPILPPIPHVESVEATDDPLNSLPIAGGLGSKKGKDDDIAKLVEKLKPDIQSTICAKSGTNDLCGSAEDFGIEVIEYKEQTVAGTNYFVKAKTNDNQEWHLRIFEQTWTKTLRLTKVEGPIPTGTELGYF